MPGRPTTHGSELPVTRKGESPPRRTTPFTTWLVAERKRRGLTQEEFARRAGVSLGIIAKWETGRNMPGADSYARIADAFGMPVEDVMERAGVAGFVRYDDPRLEALFAKLRRMNIDGEREQVLNALADQFLEIDRRRRDYGEQVRAGRAATRPPAGLSRAD